MDHADAALKLGHERQRCAAPPYRAKPLPPALCCPRCRVARPLRRRPLRRRWCDTACLRKPQRPARAAMRASCARPVILLHSLSTDLRVAAMRARIHSSAYSRLALRCVGWGVVRRRDESGLRRVGVQPVYRFFPALQAVRRTNPAGRANHALRHGRGCCSKRARARAAPPPRLLLGVIRVRARRAVTTNAPDNHSVHAPTHPRTPASRSPRVRGAYHARLHLPPGIKRSPSGSLRRRPPATRRTGSSSWRTSQTRYVPQHACAARVAGYVQQRCVVPTSDNTDTVPTTRVRGPRA